MFNQFKLFAAGQNGYHSYRIPTIVVTKKGTILVFCEGRKNSKRDNGDIDIIMKRSFDHGETWEDMRVIADFGENVIDNPCPVVDRDTGYVWLLLSSNPFVNGYQHEICKGLSARDVYVMKSEDDGETWSEPVNISRQVKREDWTWCATGPGHALQLKNGRILIPCNHAVFDKALGDSRPQRAHVFYSDDHGASWHIGGELEELTDECTAVQSENGHVYLNMRSNVGKNRRAYAWSEDGGITWSESKLDDALIEPVCQGSVIRFTDREQHGKNRILFSNPESRLTRDTLFSKFSDPENHLVRERMTVKMSYDECSTWPVAKVLNPGPSGYSDLAIGQNMSIYCIFEYGEMRYDDGNLCFTKFDLEWLTDGQDCLLK